MKVLQDDPGLANAEHGLDHIVVTSAHRERYFRVMDALVQTTIIVCADGVDASYKVEAVKEAASILANSFVGDETTSHIAYTHQHLVPERDEPIYVTIVVTVQ